MREKADVTDGMVNKLYDDIADRRIGTFKQLEFRIGLIRNAITEFYGRESARNFMVTGADTIRRAWHKRMRHR